MKSFSKFRSQGLRKEIKLSRMLINRASENIPPHRCYKMVYHQHQLLRQQGSLRILWKHKILNWLNKHYTRRVRMSRSSLCLQDRRIQGFIRGHQWFQTIENLPITKSHLPRKSNFTRAPQLWSSTLLIAKRTVPSQTSLENLCHSAKFWSRWTI